MNRLPRRIVRSFALGTSLAVALAVVGPLAAAGAAGGEEESFATLKVTAESVSVKAKGEDDFKPAADGDEVHAGDTVRTDATGKATIKYGDEAYTRLDVDTTFKITKLTDDQGNRQVQGTIESGSTWNRTTALTESESFEQTGADATAAVEGTAFGIECDTESHCVFTGVVDDVTLTGTDGEKLVAPLDQCDSTAGVLCAEITKLTPDQLPAWIIENLLLDVAEGFPWPFGTGTLQVAGDTIVFVPSAPPPASAPPTINAADPIACLDGCNQIGPFGIGVTALPEDFEPGDEIVTDGASVYFVVNLTSDPTGVKVVFRVLPNEDIGSLYWFPDCVECRSLVVKEGEYDVDTVFEFEPYLYTEGGTTTMTFYAVGPGGEASPDEDVDITVESDPCELSEEDVEAAC